MALEAPSRAPHRGLDAFYGVGVGVALDQPIGQPADRLLFADSNATHHNLLGLTSDWSHDRHTALPAPQQRLREFSAALRRTYAKFNAPLAIRHPPLSRR